MFEIVKIKRKKKLYAKYGEFIHIDYISFEIISDRERPPVKELNICAPTYFYGHPWIRLASLNNMDRQSNKL